MPELRIIYSDRAPDTFPLGRLRITLGRSPRNDICIPDPRVSRVHAEVRREGEGYILNDLGSAYGTFHNGQLIKGAVWLAHNDRIQMGETSIEFVDRSQSPGDLAGLVSDARRNPEATIPLEASMDHTSAGVLEPIWNPEPELGVEWDDNHSAELPEPGSVRLTPYVPQKLAAPVRDGEAKASKRAAEIEAVIPLHSVFRFVHEPIGPETRSHFVGRRKEMKTFAERMLYSDGGSFLITGYRGVGKTSFVNEVLATLKKSLGKAHGGAGAAEVLDVRFNLARPLQPGELMHHIIRGLHQGLADRGLLPLLDPALAEELKLAFIRTSVSVARKLSETDERGLGLGEVGVGTDFLKATLKTSLSHKKSRARNDEFSFLGYDDKAAEQDIIRISKALAAGYSKPRQLIDRVRRRAAARTPLKVVFVFDELDKLEEFAVPREGRDSHFIDEILNSLKNLFTTSGISFVFIAGRDLQERWMADRGKGDSIYESVFSFEKYLPCMWSESDEICDRLVDWERLHAGGEREPALLEDFKSYLAYKGRGIPRRILKEFNEHVVWEGGSPRLAFTRRDARRIRLFAGLENVLRENRRALFGDMVEELPGTQEDKSRLGVLFLIDWMLRQPAAGFTLQDAAEAAKLLSASITFGDGIASRVIKEVVNLLVKHEYLRQVRSPEDQTLAGNPEADLARFALEPRRLAEMGSTDVLEHDALAPSPEPAVGSKFGHYLLTKELARGGMGQIYEAQDERNGHGVVVKLVASGFGLIKEINDRLKREARILAKLEHPNIVRYYDSGEDHGRFYLVMEFIDGIDLGAILRSRGRLDLGLAMSVAMPVADALRYVHSKNLVRIDVKPGNIIIGKTGRVYVIDFGTAKPKTPEGEAITKIGSFVGTPNYMSPEQLKGAPPDERSDIYAFGIVLYECLVGRKPFVRNLSDTNDTRIYEPPAPPSGYVNISPRLESLILRCLAPDPAKRFQSMGELAGELNALAAAAGLADLAPVAESIAEDVVEAERLDAIQTSPSVIEPRSYDRDRADLSAPLASARRGPVLIFLNGAGGAAGESYPLRNEVNIGRSPSNDLVLEDPKVSRFNTKLTRVSGVYLLQDLNPAHKTVVNGAPLEDAISLADKDVIQIGDCLFVFRDFPTHGPPGRPRRRGRGHLAAAAEQGDLLALISKVGVTLLASATLDETLRHVALLVFDAVPAERCLIMLREGDDAGLKVRAVETRDRKPVEDEVRVSRTIVEEVVGRGRSVLTSDAQHDPRFMSSTITFQGIRSVLAVPLGVGERIFGMIYADSPFTTSRFSEDHLKVLTTLGSVAAIRVENTRLLEEHLERELRLAREIQQRFQPTAPPTIAGYELQGISFPAHQIGGDYYDFITREDGRLVVALGDVSCRGTAGALLMSSLHAAVHGQVSEGHSVLETVGAVNRYLADNTPANRFVTLFYAELDPATGALAFVNAGHNPPLIAHGADSTLEQLGAGGLPLGILPDYDYREGRTQLRPGDVLVVYSDGVTETQNPQGEEFGTERLQQVISQNLRATASGIRDKIEAALSAFAQGTPAVDDITLVIVKRQ
jgi:serine/threonine protein kinase